MKTNVQRSLPPMEVTSVDRREIPRPTSVDRLNSTAGMVGDLAGGDGSTPVDKALILLRRAVADCDYTLDALQAATKKDRSHIHRVLQGDKPLTMAFLTALPVDVKAQFAKLSAEAMGFIVVTPLQGPEAVKGLVGGLLGLLARGAA